MTTPRQAIRVRGSRGPGQPKSVCVTDDYGNEVWEPRGSFTDPRSAVSSVVNSGVIPVGANPTATAGPAAVNGTAPTFMTSDSAPAVQIGSSSQKGLLQVDGTTIKAASGVISALAQCHVYSPCIVSALPAGAQGDRGMVTDSTVTLAAGLGNIVAGTGANIVPVYHDGTNWRIG